MKTSELIDLLVNDLRPAPSLDYYLLCCAICGTLIAGIAFASMIGLRADFGTALTSARFLYKFLVTVVLTVSASAALRKIGKPGISMGSARVLLSLPLMLVLAGALLETSVIPSATWVTHAIGHNALKCLTIIPLLSLAPLGCLLHGLRRGAPEHPGMAGAIGGLTAAGIAATFYAANCDDDSPLFVLLWYPAAIAIVALIGYLLGDRLLRW